MLIPGGFLPLFEKSGWCVRRRTMVTVLLFRKDNIPTFIQRLLHETPCVVPHFAWIARVL